MLGNEFHCLIGFTITSDGKGSCNSHPKLCSSQAFTFSTLTLLQLEIAMAAAVSQFE
jgi:hypothetical protein